MHQRYLTVHRSEPADPASLFLWLAEAYVVLDEQFRIVWHNRAYFDLIGHGDRELVGLSIFEINQHGSQTQRESRKRWLTDLLTNLKTGEIRTSPDVRYDIPADVDGQFRVWRATASVIAPSDGQRTYFTLRLVDVSAESHHIQAEQREKARLRSQAQLRQIVAKEATARLEESRHQLSQILAFATVGAWEMDLATGEIICTDQCLANLGLQPGAKLDEEVLFSQVIHPADRDRIQQSLAAAIAGRLDYEAEYRLAADARRWVLAGGQIRAVNDGPQHMIGFTLDISARKAVELEQQQIAGEQQQIAGVERKAREESDRHLQAMDHFLAAVSHELRSPLGAIVNWAELLRVATDKLVIGRASSAIQRNARQLSLMVEDLLDSGAIVSGNLTIRPVYLELDALVRDVVDDLRPQAEQKGLALNLTLIQPARAMGDESRIKQILWNLLVNAIKFSDEGRIDVSLSIGQKGAILKVTDTGRGLATDVADSLFDRFAQVKSENSSRVGGLGLGLWLVKNLVERHGGQIHAHSDGLGHGATFTVFLPSAG